MKKHLLFLLLAMSMPMFAQTTYNLPTTTADYINYGGSYANLFADDIPLTINGVPFYASVTMHTNSQGVCISSCNIQFWNLDTNEQTNVAYSGGLSTLRVNAPTVATGSFDQAPYVGSFTLNLVPKVQCGRYGCRTNYIQQGSTVTLN